MHSQKSMRYINLQAPLSNLPARDRIISQFSTRIKFTSSEESTTKVSRTIGSSFASTPYKPKPGKKLKHIIPKHKLYLFKG